MIIALAINTVACQAAPTFTPTPTPRLTTVEGSIAEIKFDERAILLDQRAAPYYTIQLNEDTALEVRNCRIAIIAPTKKIAAQIGKTGQCRNETGLLAKPNGIALLPNGNLLVTEATSRRVSGMDLQGKVVRVVTLPVIADPSDAQSTRAGNVLVTAYEKPGRIIEVDWSGQIVWEYFPKAETERLDRPSIAIELPNGNIAFSDDYNDRVVIINRAGKILWQYGVMGIVGKALGYLNTPNGIGFRAIPIPAATLTAIAAMPTRTATPTATETAAR